MILLLGENCDGFWAWPWPLILAFLLGLLLGWLLKSIFGSKNDNSCDRCEALQAELDACRSNAKILTDNNKTISASLTSALARTKEVKVEKTKVKKTAKEAVIVKKGGKKDNLTKIEGIGPKIQEHFNNGGIWTWEQLANTKVSRLQEILDNAGLRYRIHNPGSWPKQAAMAAKGEWDKLKKWQEEHKGGKE